MKLILFGHRGVGKSSLLERVENYFPYLNKENCRCIDKEVEADCGQSIKDLMTEKGEAHFRKLEEKILFQEAEKLSSEKTAVLALGAGYTGPIPEGWEVLWVQRAVNAKDFVFRNRPSLASDGALSLPEDRFLTREKLYNEVSSYEIELLEHRDSSCASEKKYFQNLFEGKSFDLPDHYFVTLSASRIKKIKPLLNTELQKSSLGKVEAPLNSGPQESLLDKVGVSLNSDFRKNMSIGKIPLSLELRDDWLSLEEMSLVLNQYRGPVILSFREKSAVQDSQAFLFNLLEDKTRNILWDWPLEMGECPFAKPSITSLHERKENFSETLKILSSRSGILKLAVPIHNFSELREGYQWFLEDPENRVFLPSSKNGRWQWFRELIAHKMPFSFVREGRGSSPDQPSLLKTLKFDPVKTNWGAILGKPVAHSLTPWFQERVFGNALAVEVDSHEWDEALAFLTELGMNRAAVTSPLKESAFDSVENKEELKNYGAVNTLQFFKGKWFGANTDVFGFKKLAARRPERSEGSAGKIAIWGGGGTIAAIKDEFPEAAFYSSRTGELKEGQSFSPDIVIWAVGRKNFDKQGLMPPAHWTPTDVIDLNYSDDSPGVLCAETYGCQYRSGMGMFAAQGEAQQEFWKKYERE